MSSVELNNYPHRREDNDVRHDPGHRCPVMDGTNNLITGIIWDPGHLISVRRKLAVRWMIDRLVREERTGRGAMLV